MQQVDLDPGRLGDVEDPYGPLAAARAAGPVCLLANGMVGVTGHAAALDALRDPACRSGPIGLFYLSALPPGAARDELGHRINFLDPPDHLRVRKVVNTAFTPRRISGLRPWMERTTAELVDRLDESEEFDLLHDLAHQVPSLVISELLGVPAADRELLTSYSDAVAPLLAVTVEPAEREAAVAAAEEFHAYLSALLDERAKRGDDLLSDLLAAEADGERIDRAELLSLAATLYSAGHRTTRDLVTNGLSVLLAGDGERYRRLVDGEWSVGEVVEEMLRYETPTLFVARVTAEAVVLDGVEVPADTALLVFLAAANRDPAVHESPDEFRPGRDGPGSLSFAFGAHFCLGAALARAEAEVILSTVAHRWPDLRLAAAPTWHLRGPFRGVDRLDVQPHPSGRP